MSSLDIFIASIDERKKKFITSKERNKNEVRHLKKERKEEFSTSKKERKEKVHHLKKRKKKKSSASKKERKEEVDHLKLLFDVARHIAFPLQLSLSLVDHCRQLLRDCDD